ncbi:MAG: secretin N-terminal domain-containing protein [Burkholderiales bacterium]
MKAITNLLLFLLPVAAVAQGTLEVLPLRYRTADQVIPVLRPLVEPGGALTGQSNQLIVRTSPENLAQIRQALAAIDQPQRRLMVSVRFDNSVDSARSTGDQRVDQQVQVLDGGEAHLSTGEMRLNSETATGLMVVPRVAGSGVTLDVFAQQEGYAAGRNTGGAIRGQRASSTVSGRLGEWIELGGSLSTREALTASSRRMWLKVEEIR